MDEDLQPLEDELKRLRPAAPPRELVARLEWRIAPPRRARLLRFSWVALPIAAAVAALLAPTPATRRAAPPAEAPETAQFKPVAAKNLLLASHDDGLVTLADGTPARRVRQSYVDTITWENPRTKASLKWSVPREEVRVVPVSYQ